jgi:hypothetical protein
VDEREITTLVGELAEYARVLEAALDDRNPQLLGSVATGVQDAVGPLYEVLEHGPPPWRNAIGGAWVAMNSASSIKEQLALPEQDWGRIAAAVSFAASGLDQLSDKWTQFLDHVE